MKSINDLTILANRCKKITKIKFKKGDIISNLIPNKNQFGLIIEGCADLIRYDISGNRSIVERYYKGDVFGELLLESHNINELFVEAKTTVTILFISHEYVTDKCDHLCPIHEELKSAIMDIFIARIVSQHTRISLLTQRMIRDKILAYFDILSMGGMRRKFRLHFSVTDLADYLNVDRSSLSRELSNLVSDGFILKDGRNITLLY